MLDSTALLAALIDNHAWHALARPYLHDRSGPACPVSCSPRPMRGCAGSRSGSPRR
jgi:hypothetical protein